MTPAGRARPMSPCCESVGTSPPSQGSSGVTAVAALVAEVVVAAAPPKTTAEAVRCVVALEVAPPWFCVWKQKNKIKK